MTFGERLRQLRAKKTQEEIAKYLGVARGTIARYENGQREPDQYTLQKLADFFDVSVDYLIGRSDIPAASLREHSKNVYDAPPSTKSNQYENFVIQAEALFANHNLSQTDKESLFKEIMELLWKAFWMEER